MAKIKLNIKNTQIAEAVKLSGLKNTLAKKKAENAPVEASQTEASKTALPKGKLEEEELREEAPRIKARSKSAFAEPYQESEPKDKEEIESEETPKEALDSHAPSLLTEAKSELQKVKTSAELRKEIFGDQEELKKSTPVSSPLPTFEKITEPLPQPVEKLTERGLVKESLPPKSLLSEPSSAKLPPEPSEKQPDKLGPTGRHMRDFLKPKPPVARPPRPQESIRLPLGVKMSPKELAEEAEKQKAKSVKLKSSEKEVPKSAEEDVEAKGIKTTKFKEFRDVKPAKRVETKQFDARDRQGLRGSEDEQQWRKRRHKASKALAQEDLTIRPSSLKLRLPISIKDLASEMKLKASQLIGKLFLQGVVVTLNDLLEDETTIQLLGNEFGCEITIDTTEAERIQITGKSVKEELADTPADQLVIRPPVVAFMGHVDHGKTSLIDAIRASNRVAGEAGAITQHIGAFKCKTAIGEIAILDTPGHEAFSAMRARGADVTDIVVLVVAGDEGVKPQTVEAIEQAKAAKVTIVVAINKADKPNFNPENVYRQLAENELLPETWGGQTITVNCSAVTGQGIRELLEMLALQAEVLELRANPHTRARGSVLESEMHKGMGAVATVLVQNGTLRKGDALVFGHLFGRVKTMHDEYDKELIEALPSTPVEITGLSGLPEAGEEFIVVKSEKEAREIAEARSAGAKQNHFLSQQKKKVSAESFLEQASETGKKILNVVLRTDVQGSLEALKTALLKIHSKKVDLNIISAAVGEVSESDVQLAAASKAVILGFHTQIESHAEPLVKQLGVQVRLHNIIYHAVDDVKLLMAGMLEKIAIETEKGKALVKATFKSSHAGVIAGCQVTEGSIHRNHHIRLKRGNEVVWKGSISSLKRVKEDVREVQKGMECGILLHNFSDVRENDSLEAYEVTYIAQEL